MNQYDTLQLNHTIQLKQFFHTLDNEYQHSDEYVTLSCVHYQCNTINQQLSEQQLYDWLQQQQTGNTVASRAQSTDATITADSKQQQNKLWDELKHKLKLDKRSVSAAPVPNTKQHLSVLYESVTVILTQYALYILPAVVYATDSSECYLIYHTYTRIDLTQLISIGLPYSNTGATNDINNDNISHRTTDYVLYTRLGTVCWLVASGSIDRYCITELINTMYQSAMNNLQLDIYQPERNELIELIATQYIHSYQYNQLRWVYWLHHKPSYIVCDGWLLYSECSDVDDINSNIHANTYCIDWQLQYCIITIDSCMLHFDSVEQYKSIMTQSQNTCNQLFTDCYIVRHGIDLLQCELNSIHKYNVFELISYINQTTQHIRRFKLPPDTTNKQLPSPPIPIRPTRSKQKPQHSSVDISSSAVQLIDMKIDEECKVGDTDIVLQHLSINNGIAGMNSSTTQQSYNKRLDGIVQRNNSNDNTMPIRNTLQDWVDKLLYVHTKIAT